MSNDNDNDIERVAKMAEECGLHVPCNTIQRAWYNKLLAFEQMAVKEKEEEIARLKDGGSAIVSGLMQRSVIQNEEIESLRAKLAMQAESAIKEYKACDGDEELDVIERLRFFCSLSMRGSNDWLDVERFFDSIVKEREQLKGKLAMQAEALLYADSHYGSEDFDFKKLRNAYRATSEEVAKWEATRKAEIEKCVLEFCITAIEESQPPQTTPWDCVEVIRTKYGKR